MGLVWVGLDWTGLDWIGLDEMKCDGLGEGWLGWHWMEWAEGGPGLWWGGGVRGDGVRVRLGWVLCDGMRRHGMV